MARTLVTGVAVALAMMAANRARAYLWKRAVHWATTPW